MNRNSIKTVVRILPIILTLFFSTQSIAQSEIADPAKITLDKTYPLAKFLPWSKTLRLKNVSSDANLYFPVPNRYTIDSANLHLEFTNSNALIFHRSQLGVLLNGAVVAQIKLDPDNPKTIADIVLPTEQLQHGFNHLQFRVAQHYTDQYCEVPDAPELWTQINPVTSTIKLRMSPKLKSPTLASIGYYIDEKLSDYTLTLLRATSEFSENDLKWGSLITQGVALRLKYVPLTINATIAQPLSSSGLIDPVPNSEQSDAILIGNIHEISRFIDAKIKQRITGPYLGISPLNSDSGHVLFIISGTSDDEVAVAVKTFASLSFPFPDTADSIVTEIDLAPVKAYQLDSAIQPDAVYAFEQLGFKTTTLSGETTETMQLTLQLPPDLYAREDAEVTMFLHLAYGAAMRQDSTINISLNHIFQKAIHLKQNDGAHYLDYQIALPLRAFQPGLNTIEFHPVLTPLETGNCTFRQLDNLIVTLFDDSKIRIPAASHYVRLPNFNLLAKTGFPFNRTSNGVETGVQVLDRSSQSVRSAWQIMAKLAQITGAPFYDASLSFEPIREDRNLILVGSTSGNAENLQGAPVNFSDLTTFPYPYLMIPKGSNEPFWKKWLSESDSSEMPVNIDHKKTVIEQTGQLGNFSTAMSYQSPWHSNRLVAAFVHKKSSSFYNSIRFLLDPKEWDSIDGNIVVWNGETDSLSWQQTNDEFYVGNASSGSRLAYFASQRPWLWVLAVFILILLLAGLTHLLLNRFKKEHHPNAKDRPS